MSRVIYSFPVIVIVWQKYRSELLPGCSSSLDRFPSNKESFVKQLPNPLAWEQEQKHVGWQLITRVNKLWRSGFESWMGEMPRVFGDNSVAVQRVDMEVDGEGGHQPGTLTRLLLSEEMTPNHTCETVQGMRTGRWGDIPAVSSLVSDLIKQSW